MHLKISSGKWRPFCLGLNVLISKRKRDPIQFLSAAFHGWYWKSYCLVISTIFTIRGYIIWEIKCGIFTMMVPLLYNHIFSYMRVWFHDEVNVCKHWKCNLYLEKYVCNVILSNPNWTIFLSYLFPQEAIQRKFPIIKAASSLMWFQCTLS